ncbi:MAG: hypothetical protein K6U80_18435 [Firmicutes bacterium]|nr:hypothetical protein [Bacillota bacterium]
MKTRRLTVSSTYFNEKQVPYIRLSGNWLGKLVLKSAGSFWSMNSRGV